MVVVVVQEYAVKCFWDYKLIDSNSEDITELGHLRALDADKLNETQLRFLKEMNEGIEDDEDLFIRETDALIEKMESEGERLDVLLGYAEWLRW